MAKQSAKGPKTNAMRVLDAHQVAYEAHYYSAERHSADEVAALIDVDPTHVFKTLVVVPEGPRTETGKGRPLLVMVPANSELDLKRLGTQPGVGEKKLRMATQREAETLTGLQVGGISPLALLQKGFRIFIDNSALYLNRIYVSGGQRGVNLSLDPADLIKVTGAVAVATAREGS